MVIKKILFCYFALLGVVSSIQAQHIQLSGVVRDYQTGTSVEMANIMLQEITSGETIGTTSDKNGLYKFSQIEPGDYVFKVSYVGYKAFTDTLHFQEENKKNLKNVELKRSNQELDEIIVSGA